jgi:hypothetical protein
MALTYNRVQQVAAAAARLADDTTELLARIDQFLEYNGDQAIDWAAGSTPAYIEESADGNLSGYAYSRQAVANAIASLDWIRKLLTNQSMSGSQGDHLGNLNQLANP